MDEKRNEKVCSKENIRRRYTVICVVSNKKVINTKIIQGSCCAIKFQEFLEDTINKLNKNKTYSILLDNAKIHKSKIIQKYLETQSKLKFIYNVAYSPEYNPIEYVFSKTKTQIRNKRITNKNIKKNIKYSFNKVTKTDLKNYFNKCLSTLNN